MKKINRTCMAAALVVSFIAGGNFVRAEDKDAQSGTASQSGSLSSRDAKFARMAAEGNMMEIQAGQMGSEKAQNPQVKEFAQKLVQDHTQANQELQQLAQKKGIELPSEAAKSDNRMKEHLQGLSGSDFDRQFVKHMTKDHEKVIKEFQKEAEKGDDAELKNWATTMIPKLQEHLATAQNLSGSISASKDGAVQEPAGAQKTDK